MSLAHFLPPPPSSGSTMVIPSLCSLFGGDSQVVPWLGGMDLAKLTYAMMNWVIPPTAAPRREATHAGWAAFLGEQKPKSKDPEHLLNWLSLR